MLIHYKEQKHDFPLRLIQSNHQKYNGIINAYIYRLDPTVKMPDSW